MKLEAITNAELSTMDRKFVEGAVDRVNQVNDKVREEGFVGWVKENLSETLGEDVDQTEIWKLILSDNIDRIIVTVTLHNLIADPQSMQVPGAISLHKLKTQLKLIWENSVVVGD